MGIEVAGRRGRRCRKLLGDLKERRGYCHLKEEAVDITMWRACFGRGFRPVVRQTATLTAFGEPAVWEWSFSLGIMFRCKLRSPDVKLYNL